MTGWTHDLIVIGAGAAGLTAAGGAARLGLRVALIERDRMGGECLNTGCVPSKALLVAARSGPIGFAAARARVQAAIAAIAPHDAPERFERWGVEVIRGHGVLQDSRTVHVNERVLRAPRFVLAVGSRPAVPAIPGLADSPFLTTDTVWDLETLPEHLLILGGGAAGTEMAQAFRRLGAAVTVIDAGRMLAAFDPAAAAVVLDVLAAEGVGLRPESRAVQAQPFPGGIELAFEGAPTVRGSHLLVAAGRVAGLQGLGLQAAGVEVGPGGILVDARRRTSNPRIYAIGDCRDGPRFTHVAGYEGSLVVMNAVLGLRSAVNYVALPAVLYTQPELAQVGLTEGAASTTRRKVTTITVPFADNDRAIIEGRPEGFVKLVSVGHKLVGVTIVGDGAGEMVLPWSLVITGQATRWAVANAIVPYPTRSEATKAAAFASYESLIFSRWVRGWAKLLASARRLLG